MESLELLEEKEGAADAQLAFPGAVMSRIEELMGGNEQFDCAEFDPVAYINRVFPTEQSLSGVEAAGARCEFRLAGVEHDIRKLVRAQTQQREEGHKALLDAQRCIADLALQVTDINKKAERSESMVREITSEIKQLDLAKWRLTSAITALNHLHMLVGGVDQLHNMTLQRRYKEIVMPLQAIMEVLDQLSSYKDVPIVSELSRRVSVTRETLHNQILTDFKDAFTGNGKICISSLNALCSAACVLDDNLTTQLTTWFINLQLQEYQHLFSPEQESAWLSHVEKRYTWLKKHLLTFEDSLANIFPPHWKVSEGITKQFCKITSEELSKIMEQRKSELDVKLLLYAIQKTANFESLLHKRFVGTELGEKQAAFDSEGKEVVEVRSEWRLISPCFEPHLHLYITSLEASLRALLDRFIQEAKSSEDISSTGGVVSSCGDLFLFYKKCLVQCATLSTGEPMRDLSVVFGRFLCEYVSRVLSARLPRAPHAPHAPSPLLPPGLFAGDNNTRYTKQEISRITSVITTSEYCLETTIHLEQKLKEKVHPRLTDKIDFLSEQDMFHKMISNCIQMLVHDLEIACEPALNAMTKISWLNFDNVGDQSSYVTQIIMHLKNTVPNLRDNLSSSRKYFTQFCIRFANSFIPKFIQNIYKCKPISTVGSEQLLLDTHMLKTSLLELPSIGSEVKRPSPATYTKVVIKLMTKAEMILKLVMAPLEGNAEGFVAQYVQLLPECSLAEFHKVLDMKGVKLSKTQQLSLDTLFKETTKNANVDSK